MTNNLHNLDAGDKHLLRLIRKDCGIGGMVGWTKVSERLFPIVKKLPKELVEFKMYNDIYYARLTTAGNTVVDWLT